MAPPDDERISNKHPTLGIHSSPELCYHHNFILDNFLENKITKLTLQLLPTHH